MSLPLTRKDLMIVNMGPQHPSMHGVLRRSPNGHNSNEVKWISLSAQKDSKKTVDDQ